MVVFVSVINLPSLEARNIVIIDWFVAVQKAVAFPNFEKSLVFVVLTEVIRKNQFCF